MRFPCKYLLLKKIMLGCGPHKLFVHNKSFPYVQCFVGVIVHSNRSTNMFCMQTRSITQWVKVDMLHPANNNGCVTLWPCHLY
jgi:hypothetical protein